MPQFSNFRQQDAHEFIVALLDQVQGDCVLARGLHRAAGGVMDDSRPLLTEALFDVRMEETLLCHGVCGLPRHKEVPFRDFSLPIPADDCVDLEDMMQKYLAGETVDVSCEVEDCGGQKAEKSLVFISAPPVLLLHLLRFIHDEETGIVSKNPASIDLPMQLNIVLKNDLGLGIEPKAVTDIKCSSFTLRTELSLELFS